MPNILAQDSNGPLLLVLPVPLYEQNGRFLIDSQAGNGLSQWARHFRRMTLVGKRFAEPPASGVVAIDALDLGDRLSVHGVPTAWTPAGHFRALMPMRQKLASLIDTHRYLHFALGGAWGDWGAIGALMAARRGRKASVWTDRVESQVMEIEAGRRSGLSRLLGQVYAQRARWLERRAIRAASLGLFHGSDTFEAYRAFSREPHLAHNIHLKPQDRIDPAQLAAKIASCGKGPLEIVYFGRVHPDKGPMDWIQTLKLAAAQGVAFRARWFGDGPQLEEARAKVSALGLDGIVAFAGPIFDRDEVLDTLRSAHVAMFCHQTPESPRCLIEALVCGTPIVGYASAYPRDLIAANGGGVLTAMEPADLAAQIGELAAARDHLAALIVKAARDGRDMNDEAVFAERAALMKEYS